MTTSLGIEQYIERDVGCPVGNLARKIVETDSYSPYLPFSLYKNSIDKDFNASVRWKLRADQSTTPKVIASIYRNLYFAGLIPEYNRPEDFNIVSYGSFLPTHERLLFDLDRLHRKSNTHVISIDLQNIPAELLSTLTTQDASDKNTLLDGNQNSSHRFINTEEEKYSPGEEAVDLIWNFRASLYYYLISAHRIAPGLFQNVRNLLTKYHGELRRLGCVVVDAPDTFGKNADTEMYQTTGDLILDSEEELKINDLFEPFLLGEGQARVLILKKK